MGSKIAHKFIKEITSCHINYFTFLELCIQRGERICASKGAGYVRGDPYAGRAGGTGTTTTTGIDIVLFLCLLAVLYGSVKSMDFVTPTHCNLHK
jgi:hypothetical protein